MKDYCTVVDRGCLSPAGVGIRGVGFASCEPGDVRPCTECHEPVCKECSKVVVIRGRRIRACHNCIELELGRSTILKLLYGENQ